MNIILLVDKIYNIFGVGGHYAHVRMLFSNLGTDAWFLLTSIPGPPAATTTKQKKQQQQLSRRSSVSSSTSSSSAAAAPAPAQQQQHQLKLKMAFLPPGVITQRRLDLTNEIVALYHNLDDHLQNQEWYGLVCPCDIDCMCMPYDEVPCLRVSSCYLRVNSITILLISHF